MEAEKSLQSHKYTEAIFKFRKIVHDHPYSFGANYNLALAYINIAKYTGDHNKVPKAVEYFEIALQLTDNNEMKSYVYYNLGLYYTNIIN